MSADTTLDNANMGTREDFEKQARLLDSARREGWAHRQPDIDALKAENELTLAANRGLRRLVDVLRAENERLRDALEQLPAAMKDFSTQPKEE